MSWPFELGFHNQAPYINNMQNLCPTFFPSQFSNNTMLNLYPQNYFNYSQNCSFYSLNFNQLNHSQRFIQPNSQSLIYNNQHQEKQALSEENENLLNNRPKQKKQSSHNQSSVRMVRFRRRRKVKKSINKISHNSSLRNDTKNIPKNYGKAMLSYIQKNIRQSKQLLSELNVDFLEFMMTVKNFKNKINTIHDLRQMWGQDCKDDKVKKCIRILSYHFMRMKCLPYIFNSRVKNYHTHIKYRKKIMQGIENPQKFTKIKQF